MKKSPKNLLGVGCAVLALLLFTMAIFQLWQQWEREKFYDELRGESIEELVKDESADTSVYVSPIDFDRLQKTNPDVYAWIEMPDTEVHYPILRSETDDEYYLNHTIEGEEGLPGAIYTSNENAKDFSDFNTVIYGHNMRTGAMFGGLKQFRDDSYFNEHQTIILYTPEQKLTYRIYSAVVYDDRLIPAAFDFNTEQGRQQFIDSLTEARDLNNQYRADMELTTADHLITLSTCIGGDAYSRYLVVACLQNE